MQSFATRVRRINHLGKRRRPYFAGSPLVAWGANFSKVKQANLQKKTGTIELSAAHAHYSQPHAFYEKRKPRTPNWIC